MSVTAAIALAVASFVFATWLATRRRTSTAIPVRDAAEPTTATERASIAALLRQVERRIASLETERARSSGELVGQLRALRAGSEQLRAETASLTRALRQPNGRGQWGELQLRRVVELAGLAEHCRDFSTQHATLGEDERRLRPDMVVNLPNGRRVVIDCKTPLDAYLDAAACEDDEAAGAHLARHAEQVRTHVRLLASKQYARHVDGALPDLVVLFLPAEHLFAAAVQQRADLVEDAFARGVMLASPTTLLTLLHSVAQGWREQRLAEGAEEIARLGRELHERIATMASHFAGVGSRLDAAVEAYNRTVGTLERRVLPTARRFERLDAAGANTRIPELDASEARTRPLLAPELAEAIEQAARASGGAGRVA